MKALTPIWKHRLEIATVLQFMVANLISADLVTGTPMKWVLYLNGCLTASIVVMNKYKELRAAKNAPLTEDTGDDVVIPGDPQ
jgi:hypothetical protein